ncbi:WGR domain-containing protein [Microvirga arabica]|uniref:WGR domain-containing protein n=1 Tax=Microvirga arabica TaxID=1128671 RepID=A0ABV6Y5I6_9HYPH|nr:WGR domain-containing protein [Microvirga arabica]MBM1172234.1 WGR domain-containing protein [Microvirga arabica]
MIERVPLGIVRRARNWGGIGTNGQEPAEVFADELEAGLTLEAIAQAKRRRGYQDL